MKASRFVKLSADKRDEQLEAAFYDMYKAKRPL